MMNFPTAQMVAKKRHPIARAVWISEVDPKWLTFEGGVWFVNTKDGRNVVTGGADPNITENDLHALDWQAPDACRFADITALDNFPLAGGGDSGGAFDLNDPPCVI